MADRTIGKLAAAGEVGVETVRYYQRRGLLDTPKRAGESINGGIRRYGDETLRRLKFIRAAQAAGFTLDQIAELLELDASEGIAPASTRSPKKRLAALDAKIADLTAARSALRRLADDCGSGGAGPCPIILAFERS